MNLLASIAVLFALLQPAPPPATFIGVYRGMESGRVVIQVENDQNLRMFVIGSTRFIRNGKRVKASDFQDGDPVEVDAERDARMNLVARRVELAKPKPKKPPSTSETPN